ncbi:MAG: hypothetical protein KC439_07820 [Yoonia sp.]|nr:hypothetical protein [Yoonia sp.]
MKSVLSIVFFAGMTVAAQGQTQFDTLTSGADQFTAGSSYEKQYSAERDAFAVGNVVSASGTVAGDVHIVGFDVDVSARTGADLYAIGGTVKVEADVVEDLSIMGYSVQLKDGATVGGNARMLGQTVVVDGVVTGALMASGAEVILNGQINGDATLYASRLTFGPDAQIAGQLTYASEVPVQIPESVIAAGRVTVDDWHFSDRRQEIKDNWDHIEMPVIPTMLTLFKGFLISLLFFIAIGALFLALMPKRVSALRQQITDEPGRTFLLGILGLSVLFGLVPISALTIIGIPFIPFAVFLVFVAWTLGYILAAYAIAMRAMIAFDGPEDPSMLVQLVVLAVAVCVVVALNFIPFVGWVVNFSLVLFGVGAMTHAVLNRMIGGVGVDSRDA